MPYAYVASIDTADSFNDFYRFQAILTRDAIITSWKLYVFTFHLTIVYVNIEIWSSVDTADSFFWLLNVPGHFDEGHHHLQLKTVCTYFPWYSIKCLMHILTNVYVNTVICCKCWYCWFFFQTFTGSRPFRRGTPSSPVENCMCTWLHSVVFSKSILYTYVELVFWLIII